MRKYHITGLPLCHALNSLMTAALVLLCALPVMAVTDKEMEEARTIAAQAYLRYANDGSGYLDDLHPKNMADLKKSLKDKEKENLRAFQNVKTPGDYASWDKEKLVQYWGETFFRSPGLLEKGRIGKNRARARIQRMTVQPPKKEAPKPAEKPVAQPAADTAGQPAATMSAAASADTSAKTVESPVATAATSAAEDDLVAMADSIDAAAAEMADAGPERRKSDSTWVYILILCVLVAVVVALVIFASSTMKKQKDDEPLTPEARDRKMRAENEARAAARAAEADLKARLEDASAEMTGLRAERDELRGRIRDLEQRLERSEAALAASRHPVLTAAPKPAPAAPTHAPASAPRAAAGGKIYLGRVNSRGIFVRADRSLNIEASVYVLETEDGYSGTFRVARNRKVWQRLLEDTGHWLAGGCAVMDEDVDGASAIVTESAGTAVFEEGCWRVIRKAKIRYE